MFMPTRERRRAGLVAVTLIAAVLAVLAVKVTNPHVPTIPVPSAGADLQLTASCTYGTDNATLDARPWDDESGGYMGNAEVLAWKSCGGVRYGRYFSYRFYASPRDTGPGPSWTHLNCSPGVLRSVKVNPGATGGINPGMRQVACQSDPDGMTLTIDLADWRVTTDPCTGTLITIDQDNRPDPYYTLPSLCVGQ